MKRVLCLLLCLMLVPLAAIGENVEDSLLVGMISTRTTEIRPLTPQERDMASLYGVVYESLVTVDDNGLPQPLLAESWTESGGGQTWTFTLRENITFSDGTPLTAQDVVASGQPTASMSSRAVSLSGMRRPMEPAAERKAAGTASLASTMSVRGPGQYARARRRARSGTCAP